MLRQSLDGKSFWEAYRCFLDEEEVFAPVPEELKEMTQE